jgi:hypothetical protein
MKELPIAGGHTVLVDDDDYASVAGFNWFARPGKRGKTLYALRSRMVGENGPRWVRMHRQILGLTGDQEADHRDGNGLNNRRGNLRPCTRLQNLVNRGSNAVQRRTSIYKGVSWQTKGARYRSRISMHGQAVHLGSFDREIEAAAAYDLAAQRLFGEFAWLNRDHFPEVAS